MPSPSLHDSPALAPPGAGLPKLELFVAGLIVRWGLMRGSRGKSVSEFARRQEEILKLAGSCDAGSGGRRVLIRRLAGMEDSSRNWSVFMTLDHLRITNDAMAEAIAALAAGRVPPRVASTAAVKPAENVDQGIVSAFEESCRNFERTLAAVPDFATGVKYAHPWFGPLDAAGWHFMAGFHMNLHRKQIEAILAGLAGSGRPGLNP